MHNEDRGNSVAAVKGSVPLEADHASKSSTHVGYNRPQTAETRPATAPFLCYCHNQSDCDGPLLTPHPWMDEGPILMVCVFISYPAIIKWAVL